MIASEVLIDTILKLYMNSIISQQYTFTLIKFLLNLFDYSAVSMLVGVVIGGIATYVAQDLTLYKFVSGQK